MLPGQFDRGLRQWLRQLRPPRLGAAKLIELTLQLQQTIDVCLLFKGKCFANNVSLKQPTAQQAAV
jgi:hypothetical protein